MDDKDAKQRFAEELVMVMLPLSSWLGPASVAIVMEELRKVLAKYDVTEKADG